jgi:hypothetical protein
MNFGDALLLIRDGKKIRLGHWREDLYLYMDDKKDTLTGPGIDSREIFMVEHENLIDTGDGLEVPVCVYRFYSGDLLADDWEEYKEPQVPSVDFAFALRMMRHEGKRYRRKIWTNPNLNIAIESEHSSFSLYSKGKLQSRDYSFYFEDLCAEDWEEYKTE